MGKLLNNLQKQLNNPEYAKDAIDCLKIYNWIKETDPEGRVWSSRWNPLVSTTWEGKYPYSIARYKPTIIGSTLLKGIESEQVDTLLSCPKCTSTNIIKFPEHYDCQVCGHVW